MLYFECDYNNGAHEAILKKLIETNGEKLGGYGEDACCKRAAEKILKACGCENGQVRFLLGDHGERSGRAAGSTSEHRVKINVVSIT